MSEGRAQELGVLGSDGRLSEHALPVIAECRAVSIMGAGYYDAACVFEDGREEHVLGESESGTLPDADWFVGKNTSKAAKYSLVDQFARK
jgi:hypothetical protein